MKKFLILDANSIVNRAFYAVKLLSTKDGVFTNAIFGFLNILFRYTEEINPDYIGAAFDLPKPTFRHNMYDGYKKTRKKMPEELAMQIPILKEILTAMHIPVYEQEGYEADDIIGTCAAFCEKKDLQCCILTGDRDDLQLASDKVHIHLVTTRQGKTDTEVFDHNGVYKKYGVTPKEFIELKAIMGDTSDNIPGVRGIGEKGATALISAFHSVDGVYANIDDTSITSAVRKKLKEGKDDAYLSLDLARICTDVPIDFSLENAVVSQPDNGALYTLFSKLAFHTFIKKMGLTPQVDENAKTRDFSAAEYMNVKDTVDFADICEQTVLSFLFESDGQVICLANDNKAWRVPVTETFLPYLQKIFDGCKTVVTHQWKNAIGIAERTGLQIHCDYDTKIAAYLLEPARKSYDIEDLALSYADILLDEAQDATQISLIDMDEGDSRGCMQRALAIHTLYEETKKLLEEQGELSLFYDMEMPLIEVLYEMEKNGIAVDQEKLREFGAVMCTEQQKSEKQIYDYAGHPFQILSPKQLGTVLFEELNITPVKKTKTGYSTSAEVLEKCKHAHPIVKEVLEYRKVSKLNSTYVDGILNAIDKKDGRVHSEFHQTVTVTGRISSSEPNLQNIPVRTELGRQMRKMFVAQNPAWVLIDADYSQIELRVLAHLSQDENMIAAFRENVDIHTRTAANIFHTVPDDVTAQMRSVAKTINFGLVYGMGEYSLSQDLGISVKEAKQYMEDYLGTYPKVRAFMQQSVVTAKEQGYTQTLFGRRRDLPELRGSDYQTKMFGERAAMNAPVQGTAADIIKIAMIHVSKRLKQENLQAKLILQVHDELILESPVEEADAAERILREEMENAVALSVPLKVDLKRGHSWYDTK